MRVGVVILPQFDAPETTRRWKALEDMGFAHGWTYDHLAWRDLADEPWHATMPTLTVAAMATNTLRIGTWVASPNFRHPVTLAKDLMTLDVISGGRVIAGIGAGGIGWDSAVFGRPALPPRERVDRLAEFVELTDVLLREPVTTWRGDYFEAVDARTLPGCVQDPRLPIVVAANGPRGMRIAATLGDGWATTGAAADDIESWWAGILTTVRTFDDVAAKAGRDPATIDRYLSLDGAPVFSLASVEAFVDAAGLAAELRFTDVITHWPRASKQYVGDPAVLEKVAGLLGDGGHVQL
jgi:alkanesulfonate monooxygenase SsuD/methylene tetrahydromethanopterin reductase-like flavin-dependent oxidoreductase (luciferase family)